jgi:hypothetical protein
MKEKLTVIEGGTEDPLLLYYKHVVIHPSPSYQIMSDDRHQLLCEMVVQKGIFEIESMVGKMMDPDKPFKPWVCNGLRSPWRLVCHKVEEAGVDNIIIARPPAQIGDTTVLISMGGITVKARMGTSCVAMLVGVGQICGAAIEVLVNEDVVGEIHYSWNNLADPPFEKGDLMSSNEAALYNASIIKERSDAISAERAKLKLPYKRTKRPL